MVVLDWSSPTLPCSARKLAIVHSGPLVLPFVIGRLSYLAWQPVHKTSRATKSLPPFCMYLAVVGSLSRASTEISQQHSASPLVMRQIVRDCLSQAAAAVMVVQADACAQAAENVQLFFRQIFAFT
jgi:hypothetical protein